MAIWLTQHSKVLVQGMTGSEGRKHTQRMLNAGTNIVGGVTPGKGGQTVEFDDRVEQPVFDSVGEAVANWIRSLPELPSYDVNLRTVLVAHLNVAGADVNRGLLRIDERSDVVLDAGTLPTGFDYVALGHVHKPQCLRGLSHIRYSGSLDRMDFGDEDPAKEVVLVDIGPDGCRGVIPVPIEPTPLVTATISDPAAVAAQIAAQVSDPAAAVVREIVVPLGHLDGAITAVAAVVGVNEAANPRQVALERQHQQIAQQTNVFAVIARNAARHRHPEQGDDRIASILPNDALVAGDFPSHGIHVLAEPVYDDLGPDPFGRRGVPREVREQRGDDDALRPRPSAVHELLAVLPDGRRDFRGDVTREQLHELRASPRFFVRHVRRDEAG